VEIEPRSPEICVVDSTTQQISDRGRSVSVAHAHLRRREQLAGAMPRVDADGNPISCTWYTLDGQARGGCFRRGSRRLGCRRRDAGNGEDAVEVVERSVTVHNLFDRHGAQPL
jgi:hypothetical protein